MIQMNILLLPTAYPNIYNDHSSIFVQDQAEALVKSGLNVSVIGAIPISFKYIFRKKILKFGNFRSYKNGVYIHLFLFPSIPKLKRLNQYIRYKINNILLKKYHKSKKVDLIHVHNVTAGKAAMWTKNKYGIPYCITEHFSGFALNKMSESEIKSYIDLYKNSFYNIAVSKKFCSLLEDIYKLKFQYVPNVVDTNFFMPLKQDDRKGFNFINIANLNKNKNQDMLIEAFSHSFKGYENIKLSVLGGGPESKNLQKKIEKLGMENQIKLHGFATRPQILKELQRSDVFVLSSKYETFGVVLIEAMSCGLPLIATKCGGPDSIITNEKLGLLVENNNVIKLSEAMKKVYEKRNQYNSSFIREYAVRNFSEQAVATKLITIYRECIE